MTIVASQTAAAFALAIASVSILNGLLLPTCGATDFM
jgi:hypothetical protein